VDFKPLVFNINTAPWCRFKTHGVKSTSYWCWYNIKTARIIQAPGYFLECRYAKTQLCTRYLLSQDRRSWAESIPALFLPRIILVNNETRGHFSINALLSDVGAVYACRCTRDWFKRTTAEKRHVHARTHPNGLLPKIAFNAETERAMSATGAVSWRTRREFNTYHYRSIIYWRPV